MTGERLAWFRVASHLHIPVEELAERITHREFLSWLDYLEWQDNYHSKQDYYMAQISTMIMRSVVKEPAKVKLKDHLITFLEPGEKRKQDSKSAWMGLFGFGKFKKPKPKVKK